DLTSAVRPEPGDGAEDGALAAAGRSRQEEVLSPAEDQIRVPDERPPRRKRDVDAVERDLVHGARDDADAAGADRPRFGRCHPPAEGEQALDAGPPRRELRVAVDEPAERVLDPAEGGGDLHQLAELDGPGEVARSRHQDGEDTGGLAVACREPGDALLHPNELPPVVEDRREALAQAPLLKRLPGRESHLLGALAQPNQAEAEVRLGALPSRVQADERPADEVGDDA